MTWCGLIWPNNFGTFYFLKFGDYIHYIPHPVVAGTKHKPNFGQGIANIVAPLFGGIAGTGAIVRSAVNDLVVGVPAPPHRRSRPASRIMASNAEIQRTTYGYHSPS